MKKILAIAQKDLRLRFSSRSELLFFLILPIIFTFLLSGVGGEPTSAALPRLLLTDADQSEWSAQFIQTLQANTAFETTLMDDPAAARALFEEGDTPGWLHIPQGFDDAARSGAAFTLEFRGIPNDMNADLLERAITRTLSDLERPLYAARQSEQAAAQIRPFANAAEQRAYFEQSLALAQSLLPRAETVVTQPPEVQEWYDPAAQASAGQLITWVFIPLVGTAGIFAYERSLRTLARLLVTPTSKWIYLLGVMLGQLAASWLQMLILLGFGGLVLGVNWSKDPFGLALMMFMFSLAAVSLGVLLGTFVKTESQGSSIAILVGMLFALLGGCWFPIELFPAGLRMAVNILPTTWAMQGLSDLAVRGLGWQAVLPESMVLLGFALVFFAAAVPRLKFE